MLPPARRQDRGCRRQTASAAPGARPPRVRKRLGDYDNLAGYLCILPWLVGFLGVTVAPMVISLYLSFTRYDILSPPRWVGLFNYEDMFVYDRLFRQSLMVTFNTPLLRCLCAFLALFLAILLATSDGVSVFYRAMFYVPSVFGASIAVAVMWRQLFGVNGALNSILQAWVSSKKTSAG